MIESSLYLPLLLILGGAAIALSFRQPQLNRLLTITQLSGLLALAPLLALVWLLWQLPAILDGQTIIWQLEWVPSIGLTAGLYLDALSWLFAALITGIGTLIVLYTGQYFKGDQTAWRFLTYILLFMVAMLGVVLAGDIITLFIFWEMTSVTSFLLVAYTYQ